MRDDDLRQPIAQRVHRRYALGGNPDGDNVRSKTHEGRGHWHGACL